MNEPAAPPFLTPDQAAHRLGVAPNTVRALIRTGRISAINIGTASKEYLRITEDALADYLAGKVRH